MYIVIFQKLLMFVFLYRGVNGVLTDYLEKFIPFIHWFWYALAMAGIAGLLNFNYNDVGVTKAISLVWKL